jgi:hypothetical protein
VVVLRVEYGDALVDILDMLLRMCADESIARGVYLATLPAAKPALARLFAERSDEVVAWLGAPLTLSWPDIVAPTWAEVSAAIDAATKATGGRAVLSQRAAMKLIAPVVGVEDVDAESDALDEEAGGDAEAMRSTLSALSPSDEPAPLAPETSVQDSALNGAQVEALVSLAEKVSAKMIPLETAVLIAVRGFQLSVEDARAMLSPAASFTAAVPADGKKPAPIAPQAETPPAKGDEEPT